ncbi:hypothetical protein ACFSFZ_13965 [Mixta tenebrionis]|uniref:YD repeat-containing protein n=1 Tax=Mixta tenebrionis TaxID=2562439 RepID=A0A506VCC9_9GAMM|nr:MULTISPECIES: hypothetical protein [Mixta]QHM75220.1 hypothetical protein C7M52_01170 [Mixta theicola]TPW43119.1 hypothetical protein FKM52_06000 [Mixta tenebrionis]
MKSVCLAFIIGTGYLWSGGVALAAGTCHAASEAIKNSNSVIMLGGTVKGKIKQVVMGEFGKNVNSQKRLLSQFDSCGQLTVADMSYDKVEKNVVLAMVQHITRVSQGWLAEYQISVKVKKEDALVEVTNKKGVISYMVGEKGNIISASDSFVLMGNKGFTETTYRYDKQLRLLSSVARGSDELSNGEYHYSWSRDGLLLSSISGRMKERYRYDKQQRELELFTVSATRTGAITALNECQSWDSVGNCTLSYLQETETDGDLAQQRQLSIATRFEYWDSGTEGNVK